MLLSAISLIETTLNSHYLKHTKQLHPTARLWSLADFARDKLRRQHDRYF